MVYRNLETGAEIITNSVIIAPNYVLVKGLSELAAPKKLEAPKMEPPMEEPQKAPIPEPIEAPKEQTKPTTKAKSAPKKRTRK